MVFETSPHITTCCVVIIIIILYIVVFAIIIFTFPYRHVILVLLVRVWRFTLSPTGTIPTHSSVHRGFYVHPFRLVRCVSAAEYHVGRKRRENSLKNYLPFFFFALWRSVALIVGLYLVWDRNTHPAHLSR